MNLLPAVSTNFFPETLYMMLVTRLSATVLAAALMILPILPAQSDSGGLALARFIENTESFQADFEQTLYDDASEPLQISRGSVSLKPPGRFIWIYTEPQEQHIVADGENIWMYDVDLEQVMVNKISERIAGTPLVVLVGVSSLSDEFDVLELGESDGIDWLELKPKTASADFEQIYVGMNEFGLAAMELRDNFGQATQIVFSNVRMDENLADSLFEFKAPPGVDVIGFDG